LHGVNGTERGTAGGDDVFDDSYAIAASEGALEQSAGSVTFCLLSHGECSERVTGPGAGVTDRIRDGVGTQREPADGIDTPVAFSKDGKCKRPDDRETFRTHRRKSRIDVKGRLLSRSKRELTAFRGALSEKCDERRVLSHGAGG
jgi:hypothetical protein